MIRLAYVSNVRPKALLVCELLSTLLASKALKFIVNGVRMHIEVPTEEKVDSQDKQA